MAWSPTVEPNRVCIIYRQREYIRILSRSGRDTATEETSPIDRRAGAVERGLHD